MKDNKVNVDLIVPSIGERYNLFVPVNKTIGEIIAILNNTINEMTGCFPISNKLSLMDVTTMVLYDLNTELINSGIKNGSILVLI